MVRLTNSSRVSSNPGKSWQDDIHTVHLSSSILGWEKLEEESRLAYFQPAGHAISCSARGARSLVGTQSQALWLLHEQRCKRARWSGTLAYRDCLGVPFACDRFGAIFSIFVQSASTCTIVWRYRHARSLLMTAWDKLRYATWHERRAQTSCRGSDS